MAGCHYRVKLGSLFVALGLLLVAGRIKAFVGRAHISRTCCKARNFESELSVEEMLRLQRQRSLQKDSRNEGSLQTGESKEEQRVLTPEVLPRKPCWISSKPIAELPCVFAPQEEGVRELGSAIELKFWQSPYIRLWDYACKQTSGVVAAGLLLRNLN